MPMVAEMPMMVEGLMLIDLRATSPTTIMMTKVDRPRWKMISKRE